MSVTLAVEDYQSLVEQATLADEARRKLYNDCAALLESKRSVFELSAMLRKVAKDPSIAHGFPVIGDPV